MRTVDRAWLAGILEGEGYFGWNVNKRLHRVPVIEISMVDKDIIQRVAGMFGNGMRGPYGPYGKEKHKRQPFYKCQAYGRRAIMVIRLVLPWLGKRRTKKAHLLLKWKYHKMINNKSTGRLEAL